MITRSNPDTLLADRHPAPALDLEAYPLLFGLALPGRRLRAPAGSRQRGGSSTGGVMRMEASGGVVTVEVTHFRVEEAERLHETLLTLAPLTELILDFRHTREFHDAALFSLAGALLEVPSARLELRGFTAHQVRLLAYLRSGSLQ